MDIKLRRKGWSIVLAALLVITALVPTVGAAEYGTPGTARVVVAAASCPVVSPLSGNVIYRLTNNTCLQLPAGKSGITSSQVKTVETMLRNLGYSPGTVDGKMTLQTCRALMQFQKDAKLPVTCKVDQATWQALARAIANQGKPSSPAPQPAPTPQPDPDPEPQEPAPQPAPVSGLTADEQAMLDLVNQERVRAGVEPLKVDPALTRTARLKSQDMVDNNYFSHNSPTYGSPFDMMKAAGISYRTAGENIAGAPTVARAHQGLMNSDGHRKNILNPNFTHVGIGVVDGGPYGKMFTQQFIGR
jgi:uncharacterized YkwD family protein